MGAIKLHEEVAIVFGITHQVDALEHTKEVSLLELYFSIVFQFLQYLLCR